MSSQPEKRESADEPLFGDDEAMSLAEALLASEAPTVQQMDAVITDEPEDRRSLRSIEEVVAGSVFGQPEPAAVIVGRRPAVPVSESVSSIRPIAAGHPSIDTRGRRRGAAPRGRLGTQGGQWVTVALSVLFVAAFSGSVLLTLMGRESDASVESTTEPTVGGVTTVATVPPPSTTVPSTTAAPSTTDAPSTVERPTTVASTSTSTTIPTTTTAPATTSSQPTTAPPTTAPTSRPPTTRPPTTRPPTTQLTIPDITFSTPTWQGTGDPPP